MKGGTVVLSTFRSFCTTTATTHIPCRRQHSSQLVMQKKRRTRSRSTATSRMPDGDQRLAELEEEEERRLEEELMGAGEAPFELTDQNKETLKMVQYSVAMSRMENAEKKARGRGKLGRVGDAVSRHQELIHKDRSQDGRGRKRKRDDEDDGDYERDGTPQRSLSATARSTSTLRSSAKSRFLSNSPASRDRGVSVSKLGGLKSSNCQTRARALADTSNGTSTFVRTIQPLSESRIAECSNYGDPTSKPKWLFTGKVKTNGKRVSR